MSQTAYNFTKDAAFAGMLADAGYTYKESKAALGNVEFGKGVVNGNHRSGTAKTPKRNTATLTGAGALVASNVLNGTVNGVALSATTFATDHATTMAVIAAKIDALLLLLGIVSVSTVSGNNIIIVAEDANVLLSAFVVTAGSSQTTYTYVYTTADFFRGIALHQHKMPRADGTLGYADTDTVPVLRKGRAWVKVKGAVLENAAAYLDVADSGSEGLFTSTSTGNLATGGTFITAAADGALAILEINLP